MNIKEDLFKQKWDFIIIGAGISGATLARKLAMDNRKVLVLERRPEVGGNCYDEHIDNYFIHIHGPHIFHTSDKKVENFVKMFAEFNNFINCPLVVGEDRKVYNLPFNMNMFAKFFNESDPNEVKNLIEKDIEHSCKKYGIDKKNPKNLKEQAISLVGERIFRNFIDSYTEKQWGKPCARLDASIIKRLPLRFTYNNNYFNDSFQGVPKLGYTNMIKSMLTDSNISYITDFEAIRYKDQIIKYSIKHKIPVIYTGALDEWFQYRYGCLGWRSLNFKTEIIATSNYQGVAVKNDATPFEDYTRCIEHKHFTCLTEDEINKYRETFISYEYPEQWAPGKECYYPMNSDEDFAKYSKYVRDANKECEGRFYLLGRLAQYTYKDMGPSVSDALHLGQELLIRHSRKS